MNKVHQEFLTLKKQNQQSTGRDAWGYFLGHFKYLFPLFLFGLLFLFGHPKVVAWIDHLVESIFK